MSKKDEKSHGNKLFYVFVDMTDDKKIEYYIVPSSTVSNRIKKKHQKWIKGKSTRKDGNMRKFSLLESDKKKYLNKWENLSLS